MPQFQMIPAAPGFGEQLGRSLGAGLGESLQSSIGDFFQTKQNKRALEGLTPVFESAGFDPEQIKQVVGSGMQPQQALQALQVLGPIMKQRQEEAKLQEEGAKVQKDFDRLTDILDTGKIGFGSEVGAKFRPETGQLVHEFNSLRGALEAKARTMVAQGRLTDQQFKFLLEELIPRAGERDSTIRGKLRGAGQMLGLDISRLGAAPDKGGTRASPQGERMHTVRNPTTGKTYQIPKGRLMEAREAGGVLVQ